jgi:hypothetical protein
MNHEILPNGNLRITFTKKERENLRAIADEPDFESDDKLHDILEPLICNSELQWSSPEEIGALTSAPILAIYGERRPVRSGETAGRGNQLVGHWDGITWIEEVQQAWGWIDYAVRSVQCTLIETGETIWQKGFDAEATNKLVNPKAHAQTK